MALLDLLGRRWALRVMWELRGPEPLTFRELRARCDDVSPSVLNARLAELREAGIAEVATEGGYRLSAEGGELGAALEPLDAWAKVWARRADSASFGPPGR
jgi:DNA-binding HxlR family transcriptional regulator